MKYELVSGQINFRIDNDHNSHVCVVIKNGVFHNLNDDTRRLLIDALTVVEEEIELNDMF